MRQIALDRIYLDGGTQSRAALNDEIVEGMTMTLNRDILSSPDPDVVMSLKRFLMPLDLVHQAELACDADATSILELCVRHVMSGTISPDYRAGKHGAS